MRPTPRTLIAIPVHNEAEHVDCVLAAVRPFGLDLLLVDDGSTDETPRLIARQPVHCIRHPINQGYGQSLRDAFAFAAAHRYDWVITMDCDEQHEPRFIPDFLRAIRDDDADIVSGSRYLMPEGDAAPADRRRINRTITAELNEALGWSLTDSFCGFKAHRTDAMARLRLDVTGYDFPLQFWVQAAALGLRVAILVTMVECASAEKPRPPYSSGIISPKSPSSFKPSTMSVGYSSLCSRCVA